MSDNMASDRHLPGAAECWLNHCWSKINY